MRMRYVVAGAFLVAGMMAVVQAQPGGGGRGIGGQRMGVNAFTDSEVVEALKLTDSQKTSVKGITGDFQKESREIRAEANKDKKGKFGMLDPETQKKITKLDKEAVAKVVDLLD